MSDSELHRAIAEAIRAVSTSARGLDIEPQSRLVEDLGLDSLDLVSTMMQLQDDFDIELDTEATAEFRRVSDLMVELDRQVRSKAAA